jgi:hypothetical protein
MVTRGIMLRGGSRRLKDGFGTRPLADRTVVFP